MLEVAVFCVDKLTVVLGGGLGNGSGIVGVVVWLPTLVTLVDGSTNGWGFQWIFHMRMQEGMVFLTTYLATVRRFALLNSMSTF